MSLSVSALPLSEAARALLEPWAGPCGGLPPLDRVTPAALEEAVHAAIACRRAEIQAIAGSAAPPTFENTVEGLEDSGRALERVRCLYAAHSQTAAVGEMPAVALRIAPLLAALDDEIVHDERLFARLQAVWDARGAAALAGEPLRLLQVWLERMRRGGAGLPQADKAQLARIRTRLAELAARFAQNLQADAATQAVFLDDEADLAGLPEALRQAAAAAAAKRGRAGQWAIPNVRTAVWPFLIHAERRDRREQVWRMWTARGEHDGPHDNRPVIAEMLQLRGELARLMGQPSYAHHALADRMAATPATALALLERTWDLVLPIARRQIADFQATADREGAGIRLAPWDRLHYAERFRRERFGLDAEAVRAYLPLESVLQAMFWAAGRVHGLTFQPLVDAPRIHASVRVFEVRRDDAAIGVLYLDLHGRDGKMHGSYQVQYREAERFRGRVLPISAVVSTLPAAAAGQPVLLPWEYANVLFHEFGHALHMLHCTSAYRSLGSAHVAWDFVELPALLNERWLRDAELLARCARHHASGEPLPAELLARIEQGLVYDRLFSLNLDFLLPAIVDLRLHLRADGSGEAIDAVQVEADAVAELGMPEAWDLVMRVPHSVHLFTGEAYAAGLYAYLWSDVMAADAAALFERAAGGLYDAATARVWIDRVLSVGHRVPAAQAFQDFAGHAPDPGPLLRRFALAPAD